MEEVEAEDTQGPAVEQPETETAAQQPETEPRTEQPETEPAAEQPETVTEQPVSETAEQSVPAPSRAKKRKLTKAERAQKEVSATLSKLTAQGEDLKSALILLDDRRAKREAEQMKREEERESRMFALLSSMLCAAAILRLLARASRSLLQRSQNRTNKRSASLNAIFSTTGFPSYRCHANFAV